MLSYIGSSNPAVSKQPLKCEFSSKDAAASDTVKNPDHYDVFPDTTAIEIIRKTLTPTEYIGYLKGNILKYRLRAGKKGDATLCIGKADNHSDMLDEVMD